MRNMKKIFVIIAIIIALFLVSCGEVSNNRLEEEPALEDQQMDETELPTEDANSEESVEEPSLVDVFIKEYNAAALSPSPTPLK